MIRCDVCRGDLTAWLDRELDERRHQNLQTHLEACPACRQVLKEHRQEREWLQKRYVQLEPSPELWLRIRREVAGAAQPPERSLWVSLWTGLSPMLEGSPRRAWAGALAVLVLSVTAFFVFQQLSSPPPGDLEARQMMEQYIRWREGHEPALPTVSPLPVLRVEELKSANPFVVDASPPEARNPFEI